MAHRWHTADRTSPAALARKKQYNSTRYKRARATAARVVDAGQANCWRCGTWLTPGQPWHLGHDDNDRDIIRGPECVDCNLRAAGQAGQRAAHQPPTPARRAASYNIRVTTTGY